MSIDFEYAKPIQTENDSVRRDEYSYVFTECGNLIAIFRQDPDTIMNRRCPKCTKRIIIKKEEPILELKVNEVAIPKTIEFNYDEIKAELTEKVKAYEVAVYNEDQIKQAKQDKANLNKFKQALNQERIRREREYLEPFNDFKNKVNELIAIVDKPISVIDTQIKEYDETRRREKLQQIKEEFSKINDIEWLKVDKIADKKWQNVSTSMKSIVDEITQRIEAIKSDINTINTLDNYSFEALEAYKECLDLNKAIKSGQEAYEMQEKKKAHREQLFQQVNSELGDTPKAVAKPKEDPKTWIGFKACLTKTQALELKKFFEDRNIEFKPI